MRPHVKSAQVFLAVPRHRRMVTVKTMPAMQVLLVLGQRHATLRPLSSLPNIPILSPPFHLPGVFLSCTTGSAWQQARDNAYSTAAPAYP